MLNLLILCILCRTLFKSYFFNLIQLRFLFMTIFASRTNKVKSRYFHSVVEILFRLICIIPSNHSLYNAWITERPIFHQPSTPFITHIQPKKRERRQYITTHQQQNQNADDEKPSSEHSSFSPFINNSRDSVTPTNISILQNANSPGNKKIKPNEKQQKYKKNTTIKTRHHP